VELARFLTGKRSLLLFAGIIFLAVLVAVVVAQTMSTSNNVIQVTDATITYSGTTAASASFKDKADYYVRADWCLNQTSSAQCHLVISISLTGPNQNLYTKSMTLKLIGSTSVLFVGTNTYTAPPQQYPIAYGLELPSTRLVTITMPIIAHMGTWTFEIVVFNPPTVNGRVLLNLGLGARLAEDQLIGRTYDLYTTVQLPGM
jgi:hypothetical protein